MPDVVLFSVPTDGTNDVRLRDPNAVVGEITGSLAAVEAQDTATLAGVLEYSGTLAATEAQDTATFAGSLVYSGTLAATEAQDVASFAGVLVYSGSLAATEAQDTAAFVGTVSASSVSGSLAAVEGQDTASFDGSVTGTTQSLHGRRIRGKRVVYPDELPPEVVELPKIEPLPSLETARAAIITASQALEAVKTARIEAVERKERQKAINALSREYALAEARLQEARDAEAMVIRRLRDEDELFLLAA